MRRSLSALSRPRSFMTCPSGAGVANGGDHFLQHADRESSMCRSHASAGRSVAAPSWELSDTAQYPAGSPERPGQLVRICAHLQALRGAHVSLTAAARRADTLSKPTIPLVSLRSRASGRTRPRRSSLAPCTSAARTATAPPTRRARPTSRCACTRTWWRPARRWRTRRSETAPRAAPPRRAHAVGPRKHRGEATTVALVVDKHDESKLSALPSQTSRL